LGVADAWNTSSTELQATANRIVKSLEDNHSKGKGTISEQVFAQTFDVLASLYDSQYGGFGSAPKFPQPSMLGFLLRYWYQSGQAQALTMVTETLDAMFAGGIYDHLGGGFHRYAVDKQWLVPHFEKMLYD
jgi:uncharacterized protein YyaL (SSP411 family)